MLIGTWAYAQNKELKSQKDTVIPKKEYSKFRKLYTKHLFKTKRSVTPLEERPIDRKVVGKPIRHIYIKSQDPFGYSLQDTTRRPEKWIERTGNTLHGKTKPYVIRELLLFKKGDKVDSMEIKESERLLRSQRILRRVEIIPELSAQGDSVDIYINAIDSWSMIVTGSVSTSKFGVRIRERNFFGLGHVFDNRFRHNYETGKNLYQFNYTVPNIAKTRVIGNIHYSKNEDEHFNKGISLTRPFYSPLAKLAGGIAFGQIYFQDSLDYNRDELLFHNFKYNYSDIWAAKAIRLGESKNGLISNLIVSGRFYERNYREAPVGIDDPYEFFSDQKNYFGGIGISSRRYVKDKYIFNFNIEEDVAEGHVLGVVGGYQTRPNSERFYLSGIASFGRYFPNKNFLGAQVQYGSFFREGKSEQTTLNIQSLYFSRLLNISRWRIRQFAKVNYTAGVHRLDTPADELTMHEHDFMGIDGIRRARNIFGDQKLMVELQTQSYSPYEFLGFRISPFFNAALGIVANREDRFFDSDNIIARVGLGVMFTNDYFVFNNFQFSFSFYPRIPGEGNNIFKSNVIDNQDFNLMNFSFDKPSYIRWNRWD